jgi:hypothetical protein
MTYSGTTNPNGGRSSVMKVRARRAANADSADLIQRLPEVLPDKNEPVRGRVHGRLRNDSKV